MRKLNVELQAQMFRRFNNMADFIFIDGNVDTFKEVLEECNGLYFKSRNQEDT